MTHRTADQTEIAEIPSPGQLRKLRTLIPMADAIIELARTADVMKDGSIGAWEVRPMAERRRALDRRLGAIGVRLQAVPLAEFPDRTKEAAQASSGFFAALESAVSALRAVNAAELALIPRRSP